MSEQGNPAPGPEPGSDPADERMAELLRADTSNAELRRQLQRESSPEAEDLLSRLNALDFVNAVVGESADLPERLGDYRITGVLGRGGMGIVYLAYQEELEREVALKVLSSSWSSDPSMRQRFRAEARATASLHHRHIVPIYDYGEAQGQLYFAMERVDGLSLDKHIAAARRVGKQPLEPLDAARRFAGVADALGLAHKRRILHRDVKPGNILAAADGTLQLTDFGLAKALDQASMSLTSKSGGFLGTLHYSSPEQALGRDLTPASDLYALGVTLFEAVTGELPLPGKTTEAVLQSILHGAPRRLREVLPKPPRDLEAVLDKLLSREPGDRYQDGEELARDLTRIADGDPVHIRRQPLVLRLYRRARKNPVLSGAIVAAAVLLLTTFFLLSAVRSERGRSLQSRHQNNLAVVAAQIESEAGDPWGPTPLLASLTGLPTPAPQPASPKVLSALDSAQKEMPDDASVAAMRAAYGDDPLPAASELLRKGRGYEALRLLRNEIARTNRATGDHAADLRLYRLYLASAVANLTASVGRLGDARTDLARASFLRPGAVFPLALDVVLTLGEAEEVPAALQVLERDLVNSSPQRRAVIGRLLLALAGLQPLDNANLLPLPFGYGDRRALQALGARWASEVPVHDATVTGEGFGPQLAQLSGKVLAAVGQPARLREAAAALANEVRQGVHPQSLLQRWLGAVQLLEQPRSTAPLLDPDGRPLSPAQQLAAWEALLQLGAQPRLLEDRLDRFDAFMSKYPSLGGIVRLAAQLHTEAKSERAAALARAWVHDQPDDPEALFCRMRTGLRATAVRAELGDALKRALDDATAAAQRATDRQPMLFRVYRAWEAAAAEALLDEHRGAMLATAAAFKALQ